MSESEKKKVMHAAALRVLAEYESTGKPFSLFLSSWSFDEARQKALSLLHGKQRNVQVRIGLERQVRIILKMNGLETVAVYRKGDDKRIAMPEEWPSLVLTKRNWRDRVSRAVELADLIVVLWALDTEGLAEELEICSSGSHPMKTVVVTPLSPTEIFLHQIHRSFPRVVPLAEIPPFLGLHDEFSPLIDRMKAIKSADPKIRASLTDPVARLRKFPLPPGLGRFDGDIWVDTP